MVVMSQLIQIGSFTATWSLKINGLIESVNQSQIIVLLQLIARIPQKLVLIFGADLHLENLFVKQR